MNAADRILKMIGVASLAAGTVPAQGADSVKKPNVVFLLADDQRFDTIHALGNNEIITPNLDRLAAVGSAFTRAYIPGGSCAAVCLPSRAVLNTGRTLFHLEREGQRIPADHATIGETLRAVGYRTFGTGKWHNGTEAYARGFTDGAEIFFEGMWDHWNVPVSNFDPSGQYNNIKPFIKDPYRSNKISDVHADHVSLGRHSTELFADAAIDFIRDFDADDPFYIYLSFMAPHDPRSAPKAFQELYDSEQITLPENFMAEHPFDFGVHQIRDELLASYPRTASEVRQSIADYYAMITHLDHKIGQIFKALEETGEFENTIFIFSGDNGLSLGQQGLMGKQNLYDSSVHVPLLFAGPGIPSGQRCETYAYLTDIFPTICDLIHVDIPDSVEGISLVPALSRPETHVRDSLYFAYAGLIRSVQDERFKLIEYAYDGRLMTQLFDVVNDPNEMRNLAADPSKKDIVAGLRRQLRRYADQWDDKSHRAGRRFWEQYEKLSAGK